MGLFAALGLRPLAAPAAAAQASPPAAAAPADKNDVAYQAARAAVQKLVDALNAHAQKGRMSTAIGNAVAKLNAADAAAAAKSWKAATAALGEARALCAAAKKLADEWADYAKRRAVTNALIFSQKSADNAAATAQRDAALAVADALALGPPPKFAAAITALKKIDDGIRPYFAGQVDDLKQKLKTLKAAHPKVRAYLQGDIAAAEPLVAGTEAALKAGEWSQVDQRWRAALEILGPAVRMIDRRTRYDQQHAKTEAAIAKLKGNAGVVARATALRAVVTQADTVSAPDTMRVEEGLAMLVDAERRAGAVTALAPVLAAHDKERAAADAEIAALDAHAAAAKLQAERAAIHGLLVQAAGAVAPADAAPDPLPPWQAVLTTVQRARADLATARKLADSLGPSMAAQAAGADPTSDAKALRAASTALRGDGQTAAKQPGAAAAKTDFARFEQRLKDTDAALKANDVATARTALADAGAALAVAKTVQAEHAQFAWRLAGVEARIAALRKSPRAKAIQARIDPAAAALADAKAKDAAHDGPAAIAALRQAADAEAVASKADADRKAHDDRAAALGKRVTAVKDAAAKQRFAKLLADAGTRSDGFDFAAAKTGLDALETQLDKLQLGAMAASKTPNAPAMTALADRMTRHGGGSEVDALIQGIPDGNANAARVAALAKGRYGVAFSGGKKLDANTDEAKALKAVCMMFETLPNDIRGNPSIRSIGHVDAIPNATTTGVGGGYAFDGGTIELNGRPGLSNEQFGSKLVAKDPVTNANVPQLGPVEDKCKPVDENQVDFLAFAAAHEVGHGIDDQNGFMAREGVKPDRGGWINYGASVAPLVDIVAPHFKLAGKPEHRQYVFDKIQSKPPTRPVEPPGSPEAKALDDFDVWHALATSRNIYRREGDSQKIKIGDYIYHEAYTRAWVGYLAAARKQGLTGYQFRAPGEWFAELYAGYRSKKLKPDHPAVEWLSKLAAP